MLPAKTNSAELATTTSQPTREFAISCLTGPLRDAAENLPEEWAKKDLSEIESFRKPTEVDYYLRRNLWKQVELCQKGLQTEIDASSIYAGICSKTNFNYMVKYPARVAWLLIFPQNFQDRMEAGLSVALTNLLDFVAKKPNDDNANAFIKAVEILLNRVQGPLIQKLQASHAHLHKSADKAIPAAAPIGDRLKEIQDKLSPPPIEIEVKKVE